MSTAPAHPLLHAYLGEGDPLEIVDSPFGRMEREKARSMATGEFSGLVELSKKIRNDAATISAHLDARQAELDARADALSARELQLAVRAAQVSEMAGRVGKAIDRLEHMRADAEREKEEPLASPPGTDADPDDPNKEPEPSLELEGDNIAGTSEDPDDPVTAEDQTEFPDPELPHPPIVQTPIAAGLDDGDNHGH